MHRGSREGRALKMCIKVRVLPLPPLYGECDEEDECVKEKEEEEEEEEEEDEEDKELGGR
ncbi:hypothetical protein E2C01_094571 [Portunus trituberculatus]|uniref:Uncharacterized protein n=1 Tax=Portunus trituberculatus TaxID=210409 RepID=A0A5B7K3I5_PORTR|nr:hypothetical protein [Portunus trituberculatus]